MNKQIIQSFIESVRNDERSAEFADVLAAAESAIENGDPYVIATCFLTLGANIERARQVPLDKMVELVSAYTEKTKRDSPIKVQNLKRQHLEDAIQRSATELWDNDGDKELMIGEVAKLLFDEAKAFATALETSPPDIATIKKWLRNVAPDYARKAGRPKKA